jgi:hypothetical protein
MQLLKTTLFTQKSEFGDFELKPDEGWKISQTFIDFESGLLVVSASILDESKWIRSEWGRTIPTRQYIIDAEQKKILSTEEWKARFSYTPVEIISEDGMHRLLIKRIHEPENNTDGIEEELIEIATGKLISKSSSVAFYERKRENILEYRERRKLEELDAQQKLDAKLTLHQFYQEELSKLKKGPVICFYSDRKTFELSYDGNVFELGSSDELPGKNKGKMHFTSYRSFENLEEFWQTFAAEPNWYVVYTLLRNNRENDQYRLLTAFVIEAFNEIRKQQQFSPEEYSRLQIWENAFHNDLLKHTEYKQYCPECKNEVNYNLRYLTSLCSACCSKLTDKKGRKVDFYNTGMSGGCQGYYTDVTPNELYNSNECYIGKNKYIANEAHFGGIVVQKVGWGDDSF